MNSPPRVFSFGPTFLGDGRVRFKIWAPVQKTVSIVANGAETPMQASDGWHEVEIECSAGTLYSFKLDNGTVIPDPASRAQMGDVHSSSIVVDPSAYVWRNEKWRGRPWEQ